MRSTIEISKSALLHNFNVIKNFLHPSTNILSVVKANAYGHGLELVQSVLDEHTDGYAVYHLHTALDLRKLTAKPILLLGSVGDLVEAKHAIYYNIDIGIFDEKALDLCLGGVKSLWQTDTTHRHLRAKIHFSVNTGLNREGLQSNKFKRIFPFSLHLNRQKYIDIRGVYSHFANIEDTTDNSYAHTQVKSFNEDFLEIINRYDSNHFPNLQTHISSTAGIMVYEKNHGHHPLVRPGVGLYGLYPSRYLEQEYKSQGIDLRPVLTWKAKVSRVDTIPKGSKVGYGCSWEATRETTYATIPIGYSDGLPRSSANMGQVLIRGEKCPIIGRKAMNLLDVDVTDAPDVQVGDEVVIIGTQHERTLSAEYWADLNNTINYEITTRLDRSIPRTLTD